MYYSVLYISRNNHDVWRCLQYDYTIVYDYFDSDNICFTPWPPVPIIFGFLFFNKPIKYHILNMLMMKRDINKKDFKIFTLHLVKSE